ncbi:hypothetical protein [Streptomyces lasiicapitis]|uniref:hypothetical protein n=1 Tax=Streptomyces lasiicapitis TaxID=1923961 RepID=UPI0036595BD7
MYEMRTGRRLTKFTVDGDEAAKYSCPVTYQYVAGQAVEMAQGVKDETLSRRLRPWVMGSPR